MVKTFGEVSETFIRGIDNTMSVQDREHIEVTSVFSIAFRISTSIYKMVGNLNEIYLLYTRVCSRAMDAI